MNLIKKKGMKWFYLFSTVIMVIGQTGLLSTVYAVDNSQKTQDQPHIYHDYGEYQKALEKYTAEYQQYEADLKDYDQKKQQHDDAQAEADRVEKENAQKKADYEKALAQYQTDLAKYDEADKAHKKNEPFGRYKGPEWYSAHSDMEGYLNDLGEMLQMSETGLSLTGNDLTQAVISRLQENKFSNDSYVQDKINEYIDQFNVFVDFENSIFGSFQGSSVPAMNLGNILGQVGRNDMKTSPGLVFYHTFSSSTGVTKDNIPASLDRPTEAAIKTAVNELFEQTNGAAFDSASQQMDNNRFMIDQIMVSKWTEAVASAKTTGLELYHESLQAYIDAYKKYNASDYNDIAYAVFQSNRKAAGEKAHTALDLINGFPDADMIDGDNNAPFYNDLKSLSAKDLAGKYGYLKLLSNMANAAVYGYFHLLKPQAGETIQAATAVSWTEASIGYSTSTGNYEGKLTPPTKPTPPEYEPVPAVPEEPVKPVPPVKPVYEPLNEITLLKVDKDDQTPLANAEFQLTNKDTGEKLGTYTTASDGQIKIENLNPGNYLLTETNAPEGYILDQTPLTFVIVGTEHEKIQLEKKNTPMTGSVELTKKDENTQQALQGAVFEIRNSSGNIVRAGLQTNVSGQIIVDGLKLGDYEFVETQAPAGYELDNTPIKFTIQKDQTAAVQVSMTNHLAPGGVVLTKVDDQTGAALQGAVFELQDASGKTLQSGLTTDAAGKLFVDGLAPSLYQFIETQAPVGYDLDPTPLTANIVKNQTEVLQITMKNHLTPGGVVLTKQDAKTGETLQGAVFELEDTNGKILQSGLTTDISGKLSIDGLAPGSYQFVETQAPTGYNIDATPVVFTIEKGQKNAVQVTKTDELTPGSVILTKQDAKTGETLQGAVFELQDADGRMLQNGLTTDAAGKLSVDDLAPGTYQFVETQAPIGYELDATPISFVIEKNQKNAVKVSAVNTLMPGSVILTKKDNISGNCLQGAVFDLQDKNGNVIQSGLTTDVTGKIAVNQLEPGAYQFVEVTAPTGYQLDQTPQPFVIEKNQKEALQLTMVNKLLPGGVVLKKIDAQTGKTLAGAQFKLMTETGKLMMSDLTTDMAGNLAIEELQPGDYQLIETKAPDGYQLDQTPLAFTIEKNQQSVKQLVKTNAQIKHDVRIEKKDGQTKQFLAGAQFKLLNQAGKVIEKTIQLNENGTVALSNIAPGDYELIETKAPTGYILDNAPVKFTIKQTDQLLTVDVFNYRTAENHDGTPDLNVVINNGGNSHNGTTPATDDQTDNVNKATYYPNTGEKDSIVLLLSGITLVTISTIFILFYRKDHELTK